MRSFIRSDPASDGVIDPSRYSLFTMIPVRAVHIIQRCMLRSYYALQFEHSRKRLSFIGHATRRLAFH